MNQCLFSKNLSNKIFFLDRLLAQEYKFPPPPSVSPLLSVFPSVSRGFPGGEDSVLKARATVWVRDLRQRSEEVKMGSWGHQASVYLTSTSCNFGRSSFNFSNIWRESLVLFMFNFTKFFKALKKKQKNIEMRQFLTPLKKL